MLFLLIDSSLRTSKSNYQYPQKNITTTLSGKNNHENNFNTYYEEGLHKMHRGFFIDVPTSIIYRLLNQRFAMSRPVTSEGGEMTADFCKAEFCAAS
jgi:hypothetical protein